MKLYFCESCGKRVTDADIAKGTARDKKLTGVFCADCATGVMTIETVPLDQAEANRILREAANRQAPPVTSPVDRSRPASATMRPAAPKSRAAGQQEAANLTPYAIGAAVLVIVVIGIAVATSSGGSAPKPGKTATQTPAPEETSPTPPEPKAPVKPEPPRPTIMERDPIKELPAPTPSVAEPHRPPVDVGLSTAEQDLKAAGEQHAAGRFTQALQTLENCRKAHGEKAWWKEISDAWVRAETAAREQLEQGKTAAKAAHEEIAKSATAEELDALSAKWQAKALSGDETIAAAAQEVLQSAAARKTELEKAASAKLVEELGSILEKGEAALRVRSAENIQAATKAAADAEQRTNDNRVLIEQFAERIAALRFDIQNPPDDLNNLYRGARVTQKASATEVSWDFQAREQVAAFTLDDPSKTAKTGWDEKNRALMISDRGEHSSAPTNSRRGVPYLLAPFAFKPQSWSIQSDVMHHSSKRKAGASGIVLLFEGGVTIRFAVNELDNNKLRLVAACDPPLAGWERMQTTEASSTVEKMTRFNIVCSDGAISFSAAFGAKVVSVPGGKGAPAPLQIGVFTRSHQADEDIAFLHDNFKVTGVIDREKLNGIREKARNAAATAAKAARLREFHQREESAGTLGKNWMVLWTAKSHFKECPVRGDFNGRKDVVKSHPHDGNVPAKWLRRVNLEAGKKYVLTYDTSANAGFDVATVVAANGKQLLRKIIAGNQWQPIEVDLSDFAGSEINLELTCETGNTYSSEYGYFDLVRIKEK